MFHADDQTVISRSGTVRRRPCLGSGHAHNHTKPGRASALSRQIQPAAATHSIISDLSNPSSASAGVR